VRRQFFWRLHLHSSAIRVSTAINRHSGRAGCPYPQQPDFDSPFTNTPTNTDQIPYAQTDGGAQYDTATKMSGTASAKIPAGTSLQFFIRDTAFFNRSIAKVKFWAKRTGTKGSPRVMLVTNLASRTYFQIVPITNTDWREFSFYTSFAGLDTNLLRLDCEAKGGQLNIRNVRFPSERF
jgi:hypothetical protein